MEQSRKTLTPAGKTSNMHRLTKGEYNYMLRDAITLTLKKKKTLLKK